MGLFDELFYLVGGEDLLEVLAFLVDFVLFRHYETDGLHVGPIETLLQSLGPVHSDPAHLVDTHHVDCFR